jgi:hypothetical protein
LDKLQQHGHRQYIELAAHVEVLFQKIPAAHIQLVDGDPLSCLQFQLSLIDSFGLEGSGLSSFDEVEALVVKLDDAKSKATSMLQNAFDREALV